MRSGSDSLYPHQFVLMMDEIKESLEAAILELYGIDFDVEILPAPENIEADYSTNAPLKLAKVLHKNPMEIGGELKDTIFLGRSRRPVVTGGARFLFGPSPNMPQENVSLSSPGFLNFISSDEYLVAKMADFGANFEENISSGEYSGKTVICEFSDPNPFKVLHVGHLYTSIVGDAISRLFENAGAKVVRANFGGDVGLHVAKTLYILEQKNPQDFTIEDIANCYVAGTAAYEDDPAAKAAITKINKEIYAINAEDRHDSRLAELYWKGREISYNYFKDFYASIGLKFDKYYPESSVAERGLLKVKEELAAGVYEVSDGAVVFRGDKYGLHTRVFINKEGVPTYEAKDVGLIFQKFEDYHFDKSVVITGSEQQEYMKVVLKSVEQYAPELVEKTSHLTHGLVKLPGNVKMSSRKGNFLKAVEVLEMVKAALRDEYQSTDEKVALAATKYAFIKYRMGGNIVFDPEESVKMTGNSGPYLLYSVVRAKKVLKTVKRLSRDAPSGPSSRASVASYSPRRRICPEKASLTVFEHNLVRKMLEYKNVLAEATREMAPHKLAGYLYELAQEFSRFYENCPVAGDEKEAERVAMVDLYAKIMTHGLGLIGIEVPEEM